MPEKENEFGYTFINVNQGLTGEDGQTLEEYSSDGIHLWPSAYELIFDNIMKRGALIN